MSAGTVDRIVRYPVKSLQGEHLDRAEIGDGGIPGDRALALVAADTGEVLSAKRTSELLAASARTTGEGVEVRLPGGEWRPAPSADLDAEASAWLEREVRFARPVAREQGRIRLSFNLDDEDQDVFDYEMPAGTFLDFAAVHVLTTASLRAATALYPNGDWAVERFRPTILVDAPGDGFVEDDWVGSTIRVGSAELSVDMATVRCPMPTRAQGDLASDLEIVKTLNREHGGNLGIYCTVVTPGAVALGDSVDVVG